MKKVKILVLIGGDARFHDFQGCGKILKDFLEASGKFEVELTENRNVLVSDRLKSKDACLFYTHGEIGTECTGKKLTQEEENALLSFVKNGGGFVGIHCASIFKGNKDYLEMLGAMFITHSPFEEFSVNITNHENMITKRLQDFSIKDELYILDYDPSVQVLATAMWQGKPQPVVYLKEYGKGKVGYIALGHNADALLNPFFQKLLVRTVSSVCGFRERKPVNCAVIGYGGAFNMGKYHLDLINATPGLKGIAACDIDFRRMEVAQKDFPGIKTYTDYKDLLKNREVELIVVITPHNTHAPIAMDCLNAGKNVVIEKPMCITIREATDLIRTAKKNRVMLSVFHNRRWDGDYLTIEEVVKKGMIGDIFHIEIFIGGYGHPGFWWRSDKKISGGAFYDWGAHMIYWTLGLIPSRIKNVVGFFHKRRWHSVTNEDQCQAIIRFENGAYADIQVSSIASIGKPRWRILGEKGGIIDEWGKSSFRLNTTVHGVWAEMEIKYKPSQHGNYYANIADHLILGEPLAITPESARRVIAVIETAEKSSKNGEALPVPYER